MVSINIFLFVIVLALVFLVGYWARKYVEKRWPDKAAALDLVAKEYGEKTEAAAKAYIAERRQRAGK